MLKVTDERHSRRLLPPQCRHHLNSPKPLWLAFIPGFFSFWLGNLQNFKCQRCCIKNVIKAFLSCFFFFSPAECLLVLRRLWMTSLHPLLLQRHSAGSIRYSGVPPPFSVMLPCCVSFTRRDYFAVWIRKLRRPLPSSRLQPKAFCHKLYRSVKCFTAAAHSLDVTWQLYF